jgi:hypothetical protein
MSAMRIIVLGWAASCCAFGLSEAAAATYKCKDADGSWSEAACKSSAPPAAAHAPAASGAPAPPTADAHVEQDNRQYRERVAACETSLTADSGFDRAAAASACQLRSSKEFYLCVYHLTTLNIERINAVHTCSINPSMELVNCIYHGTRDPAAKTDAVISGCLGR